MIGANGTMNWADFLSHLFQYFSRLYSEAWSTVKNRELSSVLCDDLDG